MEGGVAEVHHIDDFERPRLPWAWRMGLALGRPLAGRIRLDEASLLEAARRRAGLDDFGDPAFREPLGVLLRSIEREAGLTPIGRFLVRQMLVGLLVSRLRVEDAIRRHPGILEAPVRSPIVIVGLPRTGTTHLHNLISSDPALRSLPYWESLEPMPPGGRAPAPGEPDPRVRRCEQALALQHWVMPLFPLMHEMTPESRHEEIQLLALAFSTMLFEAMLRVPSYRDWYVASDQTPAYRYLRRVLQVLQWLRGPDRWVLKSPQHMEQLPTLLSVFPDARVVQTHRDPVRVTASFCTMGAYGLRMNCGAIDPRVVGRYWADRIERMLRASIEDRARVPDARILDVRFHEFMADEIGTVERVYAFADQPFGPGARAAIQAYRDAHRRGRHGTVSYRLEDFGLDPGERREALRFYTERFQLPDV